MIRSIESQSNSSSKKNNPFRYFINNPYIKKKAKGKREDVSEATKGKKRPKKKQRDEDDKLRLSLRKKVTKLSMTLDDFECKTKYFN
jgi:hypothetical protein